VSTIPVPRLRLALPAHNLGAGCPACLLERGETPCRYVMKRVADRARHALTLEEGEVVYRDSSLAVLTGDVHQAPSSRARGGGQSEESS
jgi:hypothetical protein